MKAAYIKDIKKALANKSSEELQAICLRLAKFKKDNKELLTYLLFEANDEEAYIRHIKAFLEEEFSQVTSRSYYIVKKSVRKILRQLQKFIRYSSDKSTEVELRLCFCTQLKNIPYSISKSSVLTKIYQSQLDKIQKIIPKLHEDLQFDYQFEMDELLGK